LHRRLAPQPGTVALHRRLALPRRRLGGRVGYKDRMRHLLEARLVSDVFGDPALYVDCRDERRALLLHVRWRDREGEHATTRPLGELRGLVLDMAPGQRIGYVTDLNYSEANGPTHGARRSAPRCPTFT
jgi:hypothetical protein